MPHLELDTASRKRATTATSSQKTRTAGLLALDEPIAAGPVPLTLRREVGAERGELVDEVSRSRG